MTTSRQYFGTDGIRGTVGEFPITPEFVMHLGYAAGKVLTAGGGLTSEQHAGVLIGNVVEGGTIGLVMARQRENGFQLILPVGLEKLIPISIEEAAKEAAHRNELAYSMGMPCTLLPCKGKVVTELVALEILTGVTAVPISAGGLGGAEGAVTLVIKGDDEGVKKAIDIIEGLKGTRLPRKVEPEDCRTCETERCSLRGGKKHWISSVIT